MPFTAPRFGLQPYTTLYFAGHKLWTPAKIKPPLAIGMKALLFYGFR